MANITMTLEEYNEIKHQAAEEEFSEGVECGVTGMLRWLESGQKMHKFFEFSCRDDIEVDSNGIPVGVFPDSLLGKILTELKKRGFQE
jgi:hypothetical protein